MKHFLLFLFAFFAFSTQMRGQTPTYANNGAGCPIEYTGTGGSNDSVTSYTCPLPNPTGNGNLLVIWTTYQRGANSPTISFTTNLGALSATLATTATDAAQSNTVSSIYYVPSVASGITFVNINFSAFVVRAQMQAYEFYNVATASPLDQATSATGTSATLAAPALSALTTTGDLIVNFGHFDNNVKTTSCSPVAQANLTWTQRSTMIADSMPSCLQYGVYNATTSFAPTMTFSTSGKFIALSAAFKPANCAGTTCTAPPGGIRVNYVQHDNTENEQDNPISLKFPVSGNMAAMLFTSGCTGTVNNNGGDCAYPTSATGWSQIGTTILSNFGLDSSGVIFYAPNLSPGVLSTTWNMHIRSSGGNGSSFFLYDVSGAAASPLDTGFGSAGLASVTYNQTQGGAGGPITTFTATPSGQNELILSTIGNGFNTNNGITSPSGAQFLSCTYVTESNPTHCDLNGGWGLYYNLTSTAAETWTWTHNTSDSAGSGAGVALGAAFKQTSSLALPTTPGWHKIQFSELKGGENTSPCPPDNATSPFNPVPTGYIGICNHVIEAYSSAVADYPRNRLIVWGGGHADYGGNEIYSLELSKAFQPTTNATNPAIIRLTNPSTPNTNTLNADCTNPTWTNQLNTCDVETLIDGRPNARHTGLAAIIYNPLNDQLLSFGGSLNDHGSSPGWNVLSLDGSTPATLNANGFIWGLDLGSVNSSCAPNCASSWSALNTTSNSVIIQESAFDPNTGLFYVLPNTQGSAAGPYSFNPTTHVWTQIGNNSLFGNAPELAMDPEDHILLYGGSQVTSADTNCGVGYFSTAPGSNFAFQLPPGCNGGTTSLPGCPNLAQWPGNGGNKNSYWPGLVYDEKSRKFLFFGGANGGKIVVLDPRSWSCYTETYGTTQDVDQPLDIPLGTTLGGAWVSGHFSRFPNLNQEVLLDLANHDAWTLKRRVGGVQIGPFASTQTNYVYSRGQVFAQGDIPNFPSAYVDGVQIATTQYDVKNRWPDGSAKYGVVSFVIPSIAAGHIATIDFDNQGSGNNTGFLIKSDMLSAPYNFDAKIQITGPTTPAAISALTILNAATTISDCTGSDPDGTLVSAGPACYWLKGPVVTSIILEDRSAARAYDVNTDGGTGNPLHPRFTVDFYPQGNMVRVGYNLENEWASATSTLSARDQTINTVTFTGGNLAPITVYSQPTPAFVFHPTTYIRHTYCINGSGAGNANFCGPVAHIDMNQAYMESTKFFPNYDTIVLNPSVIRDSIGGQSSLTFGGCPNLTSATFCYSSGNAGIGSYRGDVNSGGPSFMHGTMDTWELVWLISQCDAGNSTSASCGNGSSGDVLSTMLSNSDLGGNLPFWWREADHNAGHGQTFDNGGVPGTTETRGRIVSLNARQQINFIDPTEQASFCSNSSAPFDWIQLPGNTYPMGNWSTFAPSDVTTHWPDIAYVSYIATGDYDYYEITLQQGDEAMWGPGCSGFTGGNTSYLRKGSTGYVNSSQERGANWALRQQAWAAFISVDGSPEKAYLEDKMYNSLSMFEGIHDIPLDVPTAGGVPGSRQAGWNFGNASSALASNPGRHSPASGQSPLQFWAYVDTYTENPPICGFHGTTGCTNILNTGGGTPTQGQAESNFQAGYSGYMRGLLYELGYSSIAPLQYMMKNYIHRMLDPAANKFAIGDYVFPVQGPTGAWVTDYANQQTFIYPPEAATSAAGYTGSLCQYVYLDEPNSLMTPAVLSFGTSYGLSDGTLTAAAAYAAARNLMTTCINGTGGSTVSFAGFAAPNTGSPKWDLVPRVTTASISAATPVANTPVISPSSGSYPSPQSVTILDAGFVICYTVNGNVPTAAVPGTCDSNGGTEFTYSGAFNTVSSGTETVMAIGTAVGFLNSGSASQTYTISAPLPPPTFSPNGGGVASGAVVTMSDTTPGTTIFSCFDTSNVCVPGTPGSTFTVTSTGFLRAFARASGFTDSSVSFAFFSVGQVVTIPVFTGPGMITGTGVIQP